jgi:hypothetical protein
MDVQITEALVRLHEAHELAAGWDDDDACDTMCWLEDLCRDQGGAAQHAAQIAAADGVLCLTTMLYDLPEAQAASAHVVLASITALPECRDKFAEARTYIEACVDTVEKGELQDANVQMSASAIANLCAEVSDVSDLVVEAGAVAALVSLLRRWTSAPKPARKGAVRTTQWVAAALCNLSQAGQDAVGALVSWDAVGAIAATLAHHNDSSTEHFLCGCLCNIAVLDPRGLLDSGGIETVLAILQGGRSSRGKRAAVQVISNLQHEYSFDINQELRDAGVEAGLREAVRAESPKALRNSIETVLQNLTFAEDDSADMLRSNNRTKDKTSGRRHVANKKSPPAKGQNLDRPTTDRSRPSTQRRLATPSRAHIWVRDAEPCECDDCGMMVDTWCEQCEACKHCYSQGNPGAPRSCTGRSNGLHTTPKVWESRSETSHSLDSLSDGQNSTSQRRVDGFSPQKAAALLLSKNWSRGSVEALLQRPEKLRAVMATLCGRPSSPSPQRLTSAPGQHAAYAHHHHSPHTFVDRVARGHSAPHMESQIRYDYSTPIPGGHMRPSTTGGYAYIPGRLPPRAATAMAQFGRSTNVAALPLWGVDVLNLFLPTGLPPRAVVYRCFGEAFARAEDLVDVVLLERFSVAVLTFRYLDENTCKRANAALHDDGRLQRTANGWPLRLVKEGVLIKTYVKSIVGDSEVSIVQEHFSSCPGAPMYEECEVLRDASSISSPLDPDEKLNDEFAAADFEAGHLRCFYRNQTDLSEFAYACASAGFSTRDLGVVQRQSGWDEQTRSPSRGHSSTTSLPSLY